MNNEDMNIKLINAAFDEIFGSKLLKEEIKARQLEDAYDEIFERDHFRSMNEDERLDDPRHGQADEINRRNRD